MVHFSPGPRETIVFTFPELLSRLIQLLVKLGVKAAQNWHVLQKKTAIQPNMYEPSKTSGRSLEPEGGKEQELDMFVIGAEIHPQKEEKMMCLFQQLHSTNPTKK
ncbi:hypothetical protein WMY93_033157 [Mugilogobius chulae]|uniref:Uncharacterized protein n=1 Tax=Mugilogobius chulae TaxID=88201 RepID=A0AAW0MNP7_9GOBI